MTVNLGKIDRIFRMALGILLLATPFVFNWSFTLTPLGMRLSIVVGLILIATSSLRFCPLYRIFGMSTCQR